LCCFGDRSAAAKVPRRLRGKENKKKGTGTGTELTFEPESDHTHTVILLHGSYYDGTEFEDLPGLVAAEAKKAGVEGHAGIKYVFPHSLQNDDGENFWYDYDAEDDAEEMQCDNDMINLEQWETQNKRIAQVVAAEVAKLGDPSKVILGGNSAGGGLAINVAMHRLEKALGGLICLRTCPMRHTLDSKAPEPVNGEPNGSALMSTRAKGMPVMVYQAGQDDTYVPLLQARNYAFIEAAGFGVEYKVKPNGTHEEDDPDENPQVAVWIVKTLFKKLAFRDAVVPPGSIFALANKK